MKVDGESYRVSPHSNTQYHRTKIVALTRKLRKTRGVDKLVRSFAGESTLSQDSNLLLFGAEGESQTSSPESSCHITSPWFVRLDDLVCIVFRAVHILFVGAVLRSVKLVFQRIWLDVSKGRRTELSED